jgi:uncharacterized protein
MNISPIIQYFHTKPVLKAWLFGSYADDTATEDSDVDILVELDHSQPIGLEFVGMWLELEKLLSKEVDLIETGNISPFIQPYIEKQKKLIYEK